MEIIKAQIKHLEVITPLFDSYRQFYRQQSDLKGTAKFLKERLEFNESIIFIAFDKDKAIGFTQLYPVFSSVSLESMYLLNDLYVDSIYRGQGVGTALIKKAKELCIEKKYKGLTLQTESSNPAQKLYEYLNFEKDPDLHYFWTNTNR